MTAPTSRVNEFEQAPFASQSNRFSMAFIGPTTKGPVNTLASFTNDDRCLDTYGLPKNKLHTMRAAIAALEGNADIHVVRVAGQNLASATCELKDANGNVILTLTAASPGTWANSDLKVAVTHNNDGSYNLTIYNRGALQNTFLAVQNSFIVNRIAADSTLVTAVLAPSAGATRPAATIDPVTQALTYLSFSGGDDGAFAKTDSEYSSTSGVSGRRFAGTLAAAAANRTFLTVSAVPTAKVGQTAAYFTLADKPAPGTVLVRVPSTDASGFSILGDTEDFSYAHGGAGLGYLENAAGDTGYVNYATGEVGVSLSGDTLVAGNYSANYTVGTAEAVANTTAGLTEYSGNLSDGEVAPSFYNVNRATFLVPLEHLLGTPPTGDDVASTDTNMMTLAPWVMPGSIVLTAVDGLGANVPSVLYDDGFGGFRTGPNGTGNAVVGTVNYRTGVWSITDWPGAVFAAAHRISAKYSAQVFAMGGGAVPGQDSSYIRDLIANSGLASASLTIASTDTNALPLQAPIQPGSLRMVVSAVGGTEITVYDDGVGGWLDKPRGHYAALAITGTINYSTGAWTISDLTNDASTTVDSSATVTAYYAQDPLNVSRRALRGVSAPLANSADITGSGGINVGLRYDLFPSSSNNYDGPSFLDCSTGEFKITLGLLRGATLDKTFDVEDNAVIQAICLPAKILGYGDGSTTIFTGTVPDAPFRRAADSLRAFQAASIASDAAGDSQVCPMALGSDASLDYWDINAVAAPDDDNFIRANTGSASIQWTSAPSNDEGVFIVGEQVVLHFEAKNAGDFGNERDTLTDGVYITVDRDSDDYLRAIVYFDSVAVESFTLAADIDALAALINDDTNGSNYVTATVTGYADRLAARPTSSTAQNCGMAGAFTMADLIGTSVAGVSTGMQLFRDEEIVKVDWVSAPGQYHRQVIAALEALCSLPRRNAKAIVPIPDLDNVFAHDDFLNGNYNAASVGGVAVADIDVPYPPLVPIGSDRLAAFGPWVQYFDGNTNETVFEPADGKVMALARNLKDTSDTLAGTRRGRLNVIGVRYRAAHSDLNLVQGLVGNTTKVFNPIVIKRNQGVFLMGEQTCLRDNAKALSRISARWTVDVIRAAILRNSDRFLFEKNNSRTWRQIKGSLEKILNPMVASGALQNARVLIDGTIVTAEDRANRRARAKIFVLPARAIEEVDYDIIITPQSVSFDDDVANALAIR